MSISTLSNEKSFKSLWSFRIAWDKKLEVPKRLKKVRLSQLGLDQHRFDIFASQLHAVNIVQTKEGSIYDQPLSTATFENKIYLKFHNHLTYEESAKLLAWRYFNETTSEMPSNLERLFMSFEEGEKEDPTPIKNTEIKINDECTLRRLAWTVNQRKAARNSRDFWLRSFKKKHPMLANLASTPKNNQCRHDFIFGLLKGNVSSETICAFVLEQYGSSMNVFFKKIDRTEPMVKRRRMSAPQRSSITDFKAAVVEVEAAAKIQKFYKKRFEKRTKAVLVLQRHYRKRLVLLKQVVIKIEELWEPRRILGNQIRDNVRNSIAEMTAELNEQDLFKYKEYVEELKDDYRKLEVLHQKKAAFLLVVTTTLMVPVWFSDYIRPNFARHHEIYIGVIYLFAAPLIVYRLNPRWRWIQTIIMMVCIGFFLREYSYRLLIDIAVCALFRKYWIAGFVAIQIFFAIWDTQIYQIALAIHDLYSMLTIQSASKYSIGILMHKWATNILCGFVILMFANIEDLYRSVDVFFHS